MTAVVGIVTASLLAAALRNALEWTNEESVVGTLLEREKNRMWMRVQAARVIQAWWFDLKKRRLSFLVKARLRSALSSLLVPPHEDAAINRCKRPFAWL
jgi:hypothetical protein